MAPVLVPPEPSWDPKDEWMSVFWNDNTNSWTPMSPPTHDFRRAHGEHKANIMRDPKKCWELIRLHTSYTVEIREEVAQ